MLEYSYIWPSDFPSGVPPKDSIPANGKVYRLVKKHPPDESDFMSSRKKQPERFSGDRRPVTYSVSFYGCLDEIQRKKHVFRNAMSNILIVTGILKPVLGKMSKPSRKSHINLWKQVGAEPHLYVNQLVEE